MKTRIIMNCELRIVNCEVASARANSQFIIHYSLFIIPFASLREANFKGATV